MEGNIPQWSCEGITKWKPSPRHLASSCVLLAEILEHRCYQPRKTVGSAAGQGKRNPLWLMEPDCVQISRMWTRQVPTLLSLNQPTHPTTTGHTLTSATIYALRKESAAPPAPIPACFQDRRHRTAGGVCSAGFPGGLTRLFSAFFGVMPQHCIFVSANGFWRTCT